MIAELAKALNIDAMDLLGYDKSTFPNQSTRNELISKFESLNDDGKQKILNYLNDLLEMDKYIK